MVIQRRVRNSLAYCFLCCCVVDVAHAQDDEVEYSHFDTLNVRGIFSGRLFTNDDNGKYKMGQCDSLSKTTDMVDVLLTALFGPSDLERATNDQKEAYKYWLSSCGEDLGNNFNFGGEIFTNIIRPVRGSGLFINVGGGYIHEVLYNRKIVKGDLGISDEKFDQLCKELSIPPKIKVTSNTIYGLIGLGRKLNINSSFNIDFCVDLRLGGRLVNFQRAKKLDNGWGDEMENAKDEEWNSKDGVYKFYTNCVIRGGIDFCGLLAGLGVGLDWISHNKGMKKTEDNKSRSVISMGLYIDTGYNIAYLFIDTEDY
jgi:hypothetical protein